MTDKAPAILIVEDDVDARSVLVQALKSITDLPILEAFSGQDGLDMTVQNRPVLIFLDLELPDMTGVSLAKSIRSRPGFRETPIVVLSNHCWDPDWVSAALEVGCQECVDKSKLMSFIPTVAEKYLKPVAPAAEAEAAEAVDKKPKRQPAKKKTAAA